MHDLHRHALRRLIAVPTNVREALLSRYEYLVTEKEMISDLTDDFRSCCVCEKWAASQDSVRCEWVLGIFVRDTN